MGELEPHQVGNRRAVVPRLEPFLLRSNMGLHVAPQAPEQAPKGTRKKARGRKRRRHEGHPATAAETPYGSEEIVGLQVRLASHEPVAR